MSMFALSEEHEALREVVRELATEKIAPRAAEVDRTAQFPWDVYEALVKAGFHALHVPEEFGGAGGDALSSVLVIEEVARACATSSLIPAVNKLGSVPLMLGASRELKQKYFPPLARGEAMFSYALSEPEAGSDAGGGMRTRAVRAGDTYVLNGAKRWITNAGVSKFYTVMAVTDPDNGANGISAFVVEDGDPGFTFGAPEHKLGIKGSPTRELYFDKTDFQGIQFMLADMAMKIEGARYLTYAAAARSERAMQGEKVPDLTYLSSACKTLASDAAMAVTTDAVQLLGGYGYVNDYPVERMMRDAKITQIYEGTNQIQRMVIARQLLK
jgi:alkylation response protein AidB-like acyl-CoA dehydrogenase